MTTSRALLLVVLVLGGTLACAAWQIGWQELWAGPDQRGRLLYERGRYAEAAASFADPMWRGAAAMRAGDFKTAEASFAGVDSAETAYDQANALVMLGRYKDAVARYDHALALKPGWPVAKANRTIALLRAARLDSSGADAGDQREGADQVVYDKDAKSLGAEETKANGAAMDDESVRALWLKRVQTQPADFLRARFAYQLQVSETGKEAAP